MDISVTVRSWFEQNSPCKYHVRNSRYYSGLPAARRSARTHFFGYIFPKFADWNFHTRRHSLEFSPLASLTISYKASRWPRFAPFQFKIPKNHGGGKPHQTPHERLTALDYCSRNRTHFFFCLWQPWILLFIKSFLSYKDKELNVLVTLFLNQEHIYI